MADVVEMVDPEPGEMCAFLLGQDPPREQQQPLAT